MEILREGLPLVHLVAPSSAGNREPAILHCNDGSRDHSIAVVAEAECIMRDMGCFHVAIAIESPARRGAVRGVPKALVDTGSEYTWISASELRALGIEPERAQQFVTADGRAITRGIGFAIVHVAGRHTADDVVFAEGDDMVLLGARSLEGLNLRVDSLQKRLVPGGPILAASLHR